MPLGARGRNRDASPGITGKEEGKPGGKVEDHSPDRYKMKEKIFDIGDDYLDRNHERPPRLQGRRQGAAPT